jgi:hypothetical protein
MNMPSNLVQWEQTMDRRRFGAVNRRWQIPLSEQLGFY